MKPARRSHPTVGASESGSSARTVSSSTSRPERAHRAIEAPSESTPSSECGETTTIESPGATEPMIAALAGWRRFVPAGARRRLSPVRRAYVGWRRSRPPKLGALRRLTPIDPNWGFERGTPIDRVYVERFIGANAADIHG